MLLWQLKNARNRHLLWLKLLACSFVMHLLFVGILFFGYRDGTSSHKFTMHNHSINTQIAVVLVPSCAKTVSQGSPASTDKSASKPTKTALEPVKKVVPKKAATQIAQQKPDVAKTTSKKMVPAKAVPVKAVPVKTVPVKISPAKKTTPIKKLEPKKPVPVKTAPVKTEPIKVEKPTKTEPAKIENPTPAIANPIAKEIIETQSLSPSPEQTVPDGPVTIEVPYNQAREFYQQEALRKELSRHWTPPHGIPDTCMCEITTYVGNNGVVTDSIITTPSGILMYDVSARAAILAMDLPRWTWGSSFTITFKP